MRIISKFHDYYDHAVGFGIDMERIYNRTTVIQPMEGLNQFRYGGERKAGLVPLPPFMVEMSARGYSYDVTDTLQVHDLEIHPFLVCLCGKLEFGFEVRDRHLKFDVRTGTYDSDKMDGFYYDAAEIVLMLRRRLKMRDDEHNSPSMDNLLVRHLKLRTICSRDYPALRRECAELKVPVMLYRHSDGSYRRERVLNPCLKDIQFYKTMDPYTTFQEIAMFVGGVLAFPGAVMVEINDKDMAAKKGFGHKYAFKTEPTKKR